MRKRHHTRESHRLNLIAAAVAACFASGGAFANPTGPAVANGQVTFHQQGNLLQITNSPNAIINWQSFSIGANEITRFLQQSASSAVLNRVITQNPSSILGALQSNGRVFLINPNGILFGQGAQIDVAGLVASTLNLSDADFLAGRLRFTEVPGAGSLINQGAINTASGGQVYLVGPAVKNEGVITSPNGEVILAAGNSVELVNPGTPNLRVEITAPDNEAVNLGQIAADAGRVGIYAGLINQSGTVQANTAQVTEDGRIVLKATKGVNLEAGSMTAASGVKGGNVTVETETGTIQVAGKLDASGSEEGGSINLAVTSDSGTIDLGTGLNAGNAAINVNGPGHTVTLNGDMVTAGAPISINDSVELGAPASITLDTTNGGTVAGGANITITGAVDDDAEASGLVLSAGTTGVNTVGGAIGGTTPIESLTTSGSVTFLNGGAVTTTGDQTYNSAATFVPASLTVNAGADVTIGGNVFSGPQSISATGDITVTPTGPGSVSVSATGSQTVVAGGALNVTGAASGANRFAQVIATDDQNISASSINITGGGGTGNFAQVRHLNGASGGQTLTVNGGDLVLAAGSGGANNRADIRGAADQSITVIGGGELSLQGGSAGANNQARIRHEASGGDQTITVAGGDIVISGGSSTGIPPDTGSNFARIENRGPGNQTVNADTITMAGGPSGDNNFAGLQAAHQLITTTGNVMLTGGSGFISGARIGAVSNLSDTDVTLNVGGTLTLNGGGGSGASVGSNRLGGLSTDIAVTAAGDITLNPGAGSGARFGSPSANVAGGNIVLTSGGNIALNSVGGIGTSIRTLGDVSLTANEVTEGSDSTIQANQLTVNVNTGADLGGTNQLAAFNATGGFLNGVTLNNGSPLLTVTGVDTFGGPLALDQTGNLMIAGNVLSGAQSIGVTGDMTVAADSSSVRVQSNGPQTINAGGTLAIQGAASGTSRFASVRASGTQNITAANIALTGGAGGTSNFADIRQTGFGADQNVTVTGGGTLSLQGGLGGMNNQARVRLNENSGNQTVNVAGGGIVVTGGSNVLPDTGNNFARIENRNPATQQTINAGTITVTGGVAGSDNFAGFHAAHQQIAATGNVALTGGGGSISGARIGGFGSLNPTDLTLNVGGALTLTGGAGSGASLGSNRFGGQPTDIVVTSAGDITSNPGTGSINRFGSPSIAVAGGNISLTSTSGNMALNSAGGVGTEIRTLGDVALTANAITQGNDSVIQANQLTTVTNSGTSLGGNNQVARFNASNLFGGDVLFNNISPLLTVTGVNQTPFNLLTLTQDGDLTLTGFIFSGPQSISATGDILVAPSSPAVVNAFGPQTIDAGGGLLVQSSPLGEVQVSAFGGQTIDASYIEVTAQGNAAFITNFGSGDQTITTHGTNMQGHGLVVESQGGFALIHQQAGGFTQSISGHSLTIQGGSGGVGNVASVDSNGSQQVVIGAGGIELSGGDGGSDNFAGLSAQGPGGQHIYSSGITLRAGSSGFNNNTLITSNGPQELHGGIDGITLLGGASGSNNRAGIFANAGGNQSLTTDGGNIVLMGGGGGANNSADIRQRVAGSDQSITLNGGGTLLLQGGAGGLDNFARVRNDGLNQEINVPDGAIVVTAGSGPAVLPNPADTANNFARIENRSLVGMQTVETGTITITAGPTGQSNFAGIQAAHQRITTTGNVAVMGGGGNSGARIGAVGSLSDTDVTLNVGGNLTISGGAASGASIGSNPAGGSNTDIVITAAGDITLSPGSGAGARIGSPSANVAGGNISLTSAGGDIELNSANGIGTAIRTLDSVSLTANAITEGEDSVIQAGQLTTVTNAGTSLGGNNEVAVFNAVNGAIGGVLLHNASPLLTVTGVSTIPGPFTLNQDGDLAIVGDVWSGPQSINVMGDMTVGADSNSVILYAAGPRRSLARGEPHASWNALGVGLLDRVAGHSPINISARSLSVQGGGGFGNFAMITGGPINITTTGDLTNGDFSLAGGSGFGAFGWVLSSQDINLNIGGKLKLDSGSGFLSFARMQTVRPTSKIEVYFPNLSTGGFSVDGIPGAYRRGLSGFYTGPHAAKPGKGLLVDYGM